MNEHICPKCDMPVTIEQGGLCPHCKSYIGSVNAPIPRIMNQWNKKKLFHRHTVLWCPKQKLAGQGIIRWVIVFDFIKGQWEWEFLAPEVI